MSSDTTQPETPSLDALEQIDSLCVDFEDALRKDKAPKIEDVLAEAPKGCREYLLRELLAVEMEHRFAGRDPEPTEYYERFPEDRQLIDDVCERLKEYRHGAAGKLPRRFGHFELLEVLGQGGMGVVYKARQLSVNRTVALKIIRPHYLSGATGNMTSEMLSRFRTEAEAAAQLEHDNIVTVYEVGEAEGKPFYAMRYVAGESLFDRLRDGPLESDEAASYVEQLSRALVEAHTRVVIIDELADEIVEVPLAEH